MNHNYTSWGLYSDPNDPRILVPKRNPAQGWTVNIGHPAGRKGLSLFLIAVAVVVVGAISL